MQRSSIFLVLLAACVVLTAASLWRSAEYDEQYTLFVTAGVARPVWPDQAFAAGDVPALQAGHADVLAIAHDLRRTDVHPPLYFWLVAMWRALFGGGLFTARLASVACGVAALAVVGSIARRSGIPVVTAMLLTLGCYGFVYTGAIARGFALAQALSLGGVAVLLWAVQRNRVGLALCAGLLLGAATFTNYLAVFVGVAAIAWVIMSRLRAPRVWLAASFGLTVWVPADLWFFLAQRESRAGQFPAFDLPGALARLGRYFVANLFGGLPLYVAEPGRAALTIGLAGLAMAMAALVVWRWRRIGTAAQRGLFAIAAAAPPGGLLMLGIATDSTPIELRYLAFATPFLALLLAGGLATLPRLWRYGAFGIVLAIQAISLGGLLTRAETMQPARATAAAAALLVRDGVVLLPRGNDGVGIVGAFADEAPPAMRLLVVDKAEDADAIRARADGFPRAIVALLGQDADSRATLAALRMAFAAPGWRPAGEGYNVLAFQRICAGECGCSSRVSR